MLVIRVDSNQNIYELRWVSIGYAKLLFKHEQAFVKFRILFFTHTKSIDLPELFRSKAEKKPKTKKKSKKSYSWKTIRHKTTKLFKSFKLEKFWLNIDTDNYYLNAFLYPVFHFLRGKNYRLKINYQGETELSLIVKNRPIRILFALLF